MIVIGVSLSEEGNIKYDVRRSCEIVVLRENLLTDRRATIRSVLNVVYFLRTKKRAQFGVYFSIPTYNLTQSKVSKNF
jgi:hypothetical protein